MYFPTETSFFEKAFFIPIMKLLCSQTPLFAYWAKVSFANEPNRTPFFPPPSKLSSLYHTTFIPHAHVVWMWYDYGMRRPAYRSEGVPSGSLDKFPAVRSDRISNSTHTRWRRTCRTNKQSWPCRDHDSAALWHVAFRQAYGITSYPLPIYRSSVHKSYTE